MAVVDWAAIENPSSAKNKRQFENANLTFIYEWMDDHGKKRPDGTYEKKQVEIVMVSYPGGEKTPVRVDDRIRQEYKREYDLWKEGLPVPLSGTPLTDWTAIPRAVCEELERFGFHTVEQLASGADSATTKLGPLKSWAKKAKEFMKAANSTQAQVAALTEQLERESEKSARYEEQIAQLMKRIEVMGV